MASIAYLDRNIGGLQRQLQEEIVNCHSEESKVAKLVDGWNRIFNSSEEIVRTAEQISDLFQTCITYQERNFRPSNRPPHSPALRPQRLALLGQALCDGSFAFNALSTISKVAVRITRPDIYKQNKALYQRNLDLQSEFRNLHLEEMRAKAEGRPISSDLKNRIRENKAARTNNLQQRREIRAKVKGTSHGQKIKTSSVKWREGMKIAGKLMGLFALGLDAANLAVGIAQVYEQEKDLKEDIRKAKSAAKEIQSEGNKLKDQLGLLSVFVNKHYKICRESLQQDLDNAEAAANADGGGVQMRVNLQILRANQLPRLDIDTSLNDIQFADENFEDGADISQLIQDKNEQKRVLEHILENHARMVNALSVAYSSSGRIIGNLAITQSDEIVQMRSEIAEMMEMMRERMPDNTSQQGPA